MLRISAIAIGVLALGGLGAAAQVTLDVNPGSSVRTRADLEGLLRIYEDVLRSPAYSQGVKRTAERDAAQIRARLEFGDFRLGDRVVLFVEGEPDLPDTLQVQAGPRITLPLFGEISLAGVLRSEVEYRLTEALSQFIRDPVVRAQGLMRVSIQGQVGQPGFYVLPADMLLSEALMSAGGPAGSANLEALRIERGQQRLMEGTDLQDAMREGLTLDQLNLQAGDQIVLPENRGGFWGRIGVLLGAVSGLSFLIISLAR